MIDPLIRRIRHSEHEEVSAFCKADKRWPKYYTDHHSWLNRALSEVKSAAGRVIFAAFLPDTSNGNAFGHHLVACLILKIVRFEKSIEFKSLVLKNSDLVLSSEYIHIATKLIEKAVRFCENSGKRRVEIELPQAEFGLISLFLGLHFTVVSIRDRDQPAANVCVLERIIGGDYRGDPFSATKFGKWLIQTFFPFRFLEEKIFGVEVPELVTEVTSGSQIALSVVRQTFVAENPTRYGAASSRIASDKQIKYTLWILDDNFEENPVHLRPIVKALRSLMKIRDQQSTNAFLMLAMHLTNQQRNSLTKDGFIAFDKTDCVKIAGGAQSSLNIPISQGNVGGVISVLDRDEACMYAEKESLTYYLFSGIYHGLVAVGVSDQEHEHESCLGPILAIYSPVWKDKSGAVVAGGIVGYCEIFVMTECTISDVLQQGVAEDSTLQEEDLKAYEAQMDKGELILTLKCDKLRLFEPPLYLKDEKWVSSASVQDYLDVELVNNVSSTAYLDVDSCVNLVQYAKSCSIAPIVPRVSSTFGQLGVSKRYLVGLSYSSLHVMLVKEVCGLLEADLGPGKVFFDQNAVNELAGQVLAQRLASVYAEECELLVPFLSESYFKSEWCRQEFSQMYNLIGNSRFMPFVLDSYDDGALSKTVVCIDASKLSPDDIARIIIDRLRGQLAGDY